MTASAIICLSTQVHSKTILELTAVTPSTALGVVFSELRKDSYFICPEIGEDKRLVSLRMSDFGKKSFESFVRGLGYSVTTRDGVLYVCKGNAIEEIEVYRPLHRSPSFLISHTSGLLDVRIVQQGGAVSDAPTPSSSDLKAPGTASDFLSSSIQLIVFQGSPEARARTRAIFKELDKPPLQAELELLLVSVSKSRSKADALDVLAKSLPNLEGSFSSGTLSFGLGDFSAILKRLETDSNFKLVSRPRLIISDGESAVLQVGDEVPVLGDIVSDQGVVSQSVEYKPSGLILSVNGQVTSAGVSLQLKQELSSFIATASGVTTSPTISKRSLTIPVRLSYDSGVAIGGLVTATESKSIRSLFKLPFSRTSETSDSELLLFVMTKRVVSSGKTGT